MCIYTKHSIMEKINRKGYLDKAVSLIGDGQIKIITGLRRSGKSYLLSHLLTDYLLQNGVKKESITSFSLNKMRDSSFRNVINLSEEINRRASTMPEGRKFIFIDEIQLCKDSINPANPTQKLTFYDLLNDYQGEDEFDVFVTGSNSHLLSKDIATDFRGKGEVIEMHPLSFKEFHEYKQRDVYTDYNEYFTFGGMPYAVSSCKNDEEKIRYLKNLFRETYLRDIKEHVNLEREDVLEQLILDLCSSIGSFTNPSKIARLLKQTKGIAISDETIAKYLTGCVDSFLFAEAKKYDIKGKNYFTYPSKYYVADIGLRNCWLNLRQQEENHIMENMIFNELVSRGMKPDVGVMESFEKDVNAKTIRKEREIDFVMNSPEGKYYIQSAFEISNSSKMEQETASLKKLCDYRKKIIINKDTPKPYYDENGIFHCSIYDFLLDDDILK